MFNNINFGHGVESALMIMAGLSLWKIIDIVIWIIKNVNISITLN